MRQLSVHWCEGLFLRPHHLQAADRRLEEQRTLAGKWDHPYGYGLYHLRRDDEALNNGVLRLDKCAARLKDGTTVVVEEGWTREQADLDRALLAEPQGATAYLAVPRLRRDEGNVSGKDWRRFTLTTEEIRDENKGENGGGDRQEVLFRKLDARLLFSFETAEGCERLPLVRIIRAGGKDAPQWDPHFVPPLLCCEAWPDFRRDFAVAVHERLLRKAKELAARVTDPVLSSPLPDLGNLGRVLMLTAVNRGVCRFASLAQTPGVHPWTLYQEVCGLVGDLAIFAANRYPPDVPAYNHDDLPGCFSPLKDFLVTILNVSQGQPAPPGDTRIQVNYPSAR